MTPAATVSSTMPRAIACQGGDGLPRVHSAAPIKAARITARSIAPVVSTLAQLALLPRLDGLRVLVVYDEEDARELVATVLAQAGARVEVAGLASEVLKHFDGTGPDVLLSDIAMPLEDGYALLDRVRRLGPEHGGAVPTAAITAFAREGDLARSRSVGFAAHLVKPVSRVALLETVARLGGRAGASWR